MTKELMWWFCEKVSVEIAKELVRLKNTYGQPKVIFTLYYLDTFFPYKYPPDYNGNLCPLIDQESVNLIRSVGIDIYQQIDTHFADEVPPQLSQYQMNLAKKWIDQSLGNGIMFDMVIEHSERWMNFYNQLIAYACLKNKKVAFNLSGAATWGYQFQYFKPMEEQSDIINIENSWRNLTPTMAAAYPNKYSATTWGGSESESQQVITWNEVKQRAQQAWNNGVTYLIPAYTNAESISFLSMIPEFEDFIKTQTQTDSKQFANKTWTSRKGLWNII